MVTKLTRAQKEQIVREILFKVGSMVEFWDENDDLKDIPLEQGREYVANLMKRLPGDVWDSRLGDP